MGSPQVLAGKCVSNPRFEAGLITYPTIVISNYSLGFKKLFKFSSSKRTRGKKRENRKKRQ